MPKYKIYSTCIGLEERFVGCEEFETEGEALDYARETAIQMRESYEGYYGVQDTVGIAEELGYFIDKDLYSEYNEDIISEIEEVYQNVINEDIEYWVVEVSQEQYLIGFDEDGYLNTEGDE